MTPGDLASAFAFRFAQGQVDNLGQLLAEDFRLSGPLLNSSSKEQYLAVLSANPPVPKSLELINVTEGTNTATIFYRLGLAPGLLVAQWFRCVDDQITESLVVFDRLQLDSLTETSG